MTILNLNSDTSITPPSLTLNTFNWYNMQPVIIAILFKKSPQQLGNRQRPTGTKAHWTISHWTKAHCLIWQGGQKPTSLKKIGLSLL